MSFNAYTWQLYLNSKEGAGRTKLFQNNDAATILAAEFPAQVVAAYQTAIRHFIETRPEVPTGDWYATLMQEGLMAALPEDGVARVSYRDFDGVYDLEVVSTVLYTLAPDVYLPYYFAQRFEELLRIADYFQIELPVVPKKADKLGRVLYYTDICRALHQYRQSIQLPPAEFCSFLYGMAIGSVAALTPDLGPLPDPARVWLIGGNQSGQDLDFLDTATAGSTSYWQGNPATRRGDIVIVYCLSPRSAIHSVWRAEIDGFADPFFHWYGYINIGQPTKVPEVSLRELKADEYFRQHKLVRKNFQGVNGYELSARDYYELLRLFTAKGFDTTALPTLYDPAFAGNATITCERDVETQLIEPFLREIGFQPTDWQRQFRIRMGRGESKYPDYAFIDAARSREGYVTAFLLIESKYWIRTEEDFIDAFTQAHSYARVLSAPRFALADKDYLWLFDQMDGAFSRNRYRRVAWKELPEIGVFNGVRDWVGRG